MRSTTPTRFELVRHVDCLPDHPRCPLPTGRFDGIIGLSPHAAPDLDNPLWSLGTIGHAYAVHLDPAGEGALVLGATADGFTVEPLARARPRGSAVGRAPDWQDTSPICIETAGQLADIRFDLAAGTIGFRTR